MAAVTCQEIRELFSGRVDDALSAGERTQLDAHLATCAECTAEWQRFERTVGLLRAVGPARAPAGFVDRVLAARPRPWYRRLARGLLVPWPVKLPLEAAAIVLVAGLAIMIFQRSPELHQAARAPEPPAGVTTPSPVPPSRPSEPASALDGRRRLADESERKAESTPEARPDSAGARDAAPSAESPRTAAEPRANRAEAPEPGGRKEADQRAGAAARSAAPSAPAPATEKSGKLQALSATAPLLARLAVGDPVASERTVGDLVARVGGRVVLRSEEAGVTVLSLAVPGDRWDEVKHGLEALGALRLEGERVRPDGLVRITLRLER
jgi:putative zinc finger protein